MGGTERFLPPNLKDYITKREIMPFYSFRCTDCSYRFELMRSVSERDEMAECPECKKQQATRLMSIPVLFTRSGGGRTTNNRGIFRMRKLFIYRLRKLFIWKQLAIIFFILNLKIEQRGD